MTPAADLDDLLLAHAAGRLPPPLALLVDAHLALSPRSRRRFGLLLELGGLLFERLEPAALVRTDPEAVLARAVIADPPATGPRDSLTRLLAGVPLPPAADGVPVVQRPVPVPGGPRAGMCATLSRLAPGAALPPHGHPGLEVTLVLEGELRDGGARFLRGDLAVCDETTLHAPAAGRDGCLFLSLLCCRRPLGSPDRRAA